MSKRKSEPPRLVLRMPFILTVTMGVYAATAAYLLAAILVAPLGMTIVAYQVNGEAVSGMEFIRRTGLYDLGAVLLSALAVFALWTERLWGREAVMACQFVLTAAFFFWTLFQFSVDAAIESILGPLMLLLFFGWYLYGKNSVREYYRALLKASLQIPAREANEHGV